MDGQAAPQARGHGRRSSRSWRADPVLLVVASLALAAGLVLWLDLGDRTAQMIMYWPVTAGLEIALFVLGRRISQVAHLPAATRRLWQAMSFAGLSYAIGAALQVPTVVRDPHSVLAALGGPAYSLCVLVGTLWLVWTMLTSPLGLRSRRERTRFWLDVATVMVAAATFGCYFTYLSANGVDTGSGSLGTVLQLLIGPTAFLVGVFAAIKLLLGGQAPFTIPAALLGSAAATIEALIRGLQTTLVSHHRVSWDLGLQVLVVALLAASARAQQLQVRTGPRSPQLRRRRPYSVLPYIAIGITYLLLVVVLARAGLDAKAWIVIGGAISSTALVVGRQLVAFADNARLLAELDKRVDELHAALAERDELAARLQYQAFHDSLTGLANRALFLRRLDDAAHRSADGRTGDLVVMLVDLDDFKPVNDRLGHAVGDQLLVELGSRLRACVADTDTVARLGGDEFAILVERTLSDDDVSALADRMVRAVQAPLQVVDAQVAVTASVGIVIVGPGTRPPGEILHDADMAMYAVKNRGKGGFEIRRERPAHPPVPTIGP
jgi:diguanylate cyclase (GGDEF)-like protein